MSQVYSFLFFFFFSKVYLKSIPVWGDVTPSPPRFIQLLLLLRLLDLGYLSFILFFSQVCPNRCVNVPIFDNVRLIIFGDDKLASSTGYNLANISSIWEPWNECGFPNAVTQAAIPWHKQHVWSNEWDELSCEISNHTRRRIDRLDLYTGSCIYSGYTKYAHSKWLKSIYVYRVTCERVVNVHLLYLKNNVHLGLFLNCNICRLDISLAWWCISHAMPCQCIIMK